MTLNIDPKIAALAGIYLIRNTLNNKVYVGSSVCMKRRFNEHLRSLVKGKHHSVLLQRFVNKHGINCLVFDCLQVCDTDQLIAWEQCFIESFEAYKSESGYNTCRKANSQLGTKRTPEQKARIGAARKGIPSAYAERVKGRVFKESHKANLSTSKTGPGNSMAKLTEKEVLAIRSAYPEKGYKTLAKEFGVDWSNIRNVVKRRTWVHI